MNAEKTRTAGNWFVGGGIAALIALALATGYVSFAAQYLTIKDAKASEGFTGTHWPSAVGALTVDFGAVTFLFMGIGLALMGYRTASLRMGNLGCIGASLTFNLANAEMRDGLSVLVWGVSPLIYAFASDRLIAVLRDIVTERRARSLSGTGVWVLRLLLHWGDTWSSLREHVGNTPAVPGLLLDPGTVRVTTHRDTSPRDVPELEASPSPRDVPELEASPSPRDVPELEASPRDTSPRDVPELEASPRPRRPRNSSPGDAETIKSIRDKFGDAPTVRQIKSLGLGSSRAESLRKKITEGNHS